MKYLFALILILCSITVFAQTTEPSKDDKKPPVENKKTEEEQLKATQEQASKAGKDKKTKNKKKKGAKKKRSSSGASTIGDESISEEEMERRRRIQEAASKMNIDGREEGLKSDASGKTQYLELMNLPDEHPRYFIRVIPLALEISSLNAVIGPSLGFQYFFKDKLSFDANIFTAYARKADFLADTSVKFKNKAVSNGNNVPQANIVNSLQFQIKTGYIFKTTAKLLNSKVILYEQGNMGEGRSKIRSHNPEIVVIKSISKIDHEIRAGFGHYSSMFNATSVIKSQNLENEIKISEAASASANFDDQALYSHVGINYISLGYAYSRIRNLVAAPADLSFANFIDDRFLTIYADLLFSPSIMVQEINNTEYDMSVLKTQNIGFEIGVDGKPNRGIGWGYQASIGMRPGFQKRAFFLNLKISIPIISSQFFTK